MSLSKVSVLIKTFLRDDHLRDTIVNIRHYMPEMQMVIVDDGRMTPSKELLYHELVAHRHRVSVLQFDSGFGRKSNEGSRLAERDYVLIGSDDFDFGQPRVRQGIEKLVDVLDSTPVDIASGRVNGNRYEAQLKFEMLGNGVAVRELPVDYSRVLQTQAGTKFVPCDLTVNYSLIRRSILGFGPNQVHWDDDVKIGGGEHGAFFVDVKRAGHSVAWVHDVDITEQRNKPVSAEYAAARGRARQPERPCFTRRNIREYYCQGSKTPERG